MRHPINKRVRRRSPWPPKFVPMSYEDVDRVWARIRSGHSGTGETP